MKKRTNILLLMVIMLGMVSLITYNYSLAKYVSSSSWNYYLGTKGFYFSSEQLDTAKIVNINNNWEYDSTYFRIKNSENSYLVTDYDIEYTVKCTIQGDVSKYSKCGLNGTELDTFTGTLSSSSICINKSNVRELTLDTKEDCEANGYEWKVQENYKDLYFDVIKIDDQDINYVNVLIEVTSNSPYSKTLFGEFILNGTELSESGLDINYKEFDNYNRVVITNSYDEEKCVKLKWNQDNLRIDETSGEILSFISDDNNKVNEIIFKVDKKNSISYVFYKTDFSKGYDYQEFTLVESNEC